MSETRGRDYEVGYGKPPKHTQFKKGRSGNPKGRPRGSQNAGAIAKRVVFAPIEVRESGRMRRITKFEAMITQAVNKAASGEFRALELVLSIPWVAAEMARPNSASPEDRVAALEQAKELVRGIL